MKILVLPQIEHLDTSDLDYVNDPTALEKELDRKNKRTARFLTCFKQVNESFSGSKGKCDTDKHHAACKWGCFKCDDQGKPKKKGTFHKVKKMNLKRVAVTEEVPQITPEGKPALDDNKKPIISKVVKPNAFKEVLVEEEVDEPDLELEPGVNIEYDIHPDSGITQADIDAEQDYNTYGNGMSDFRFNGKPCTIIVLKEGETVDNATLNLIATELKKPVI